MGAGSGAADRQPGKAHPALDDGTPMSALANRIDYD